MQQTDLLISFFQHYLESVLGTTYPDICKNNDASAPELIQPRTSALWKQNHYFSYNLLKINSHLTCSLVVVSFWYQFLSILNFLLHQITNTKQYTRTDNIGGQQIFAKYFIERMSHKLWRFCRWTQFTYVIQHICSLYLYFL